MTSSRSPDLAFNASGYYDKTAHDAITNADKAQLKERRKRVMEKFAEIAAAEGLKICSYVKLCEIGDDEDV